MTPRQGVITMTVETNLTAAADVVARVVGVATAPATGFVDFIAARGYDDEIYDARYDIRPLPETLVRRAFALIATAIETVNRPGFNFLDLVEAKGQALVSQISEAVRQPFANDNTDDEPTDRKAA